MKCCVCGGKTFTANKVLWPELVAEWQLLPSEVDYIDQQQGTTCDNCGSNIRSIALAKAILGHLNSTGPLKTTPEFKGNKKLSILEINEAGMLSSTLTSASNYTIARYPEVDMHALPYESESFDLVVHSDTLEHIQNPVHALTECRRVLKLGGALCYTVPTIVGRMSRNRQGLKKSFHGFPDTTPDDFIVHTEFGADAWTFALEAGFSNISIYTFNYPAGISYLARN